MADKPTGRPRRDDVLTQVGNFLVNLPLFYSKQQLDEETGCINWISNCRHKQNYAFFGCYSADGERRRMMVTGHRLAAQIREGRALDHNEFVIRSCGNSLCLNPDHLIIGGNEEKIEVMRKFDKFDQTFPRPKRAGSEYAQKRDYKYTEEEIRFLRVATPPEVMKRFPHLNRTQAARLRWAARLGYKWVK